jgi:hypothetical protein
MPNVTVNPIQTISVKVNPGTQPVVQSTSQFVGAQNPDVAAAIAQLQATNNTQNVSIIAIQSVNNSQNTNIQSAFNAANSAAVLAQSAFDKANTGSGGGISASGYLNNSVIFANTTGYLSNTGELAYYTSNSTFVSPNISATSIYQNGVDLLAFSQSAFNQANSAASNTIYAAGVNNTQNTNIIAIQAYANTLLPNTGSLITVNSASRLYLANPGSVANPALSIGATNRGFYDPSTGELGVIGGGWEQFRFGNASTTVNYGRVSGAATNSSPVFSVAGTDTNISATFQSKGTGAVNLATGSSGVNISNGNTVTAITRTSAGSGYTSVPSAVISPPTTPGGTQATFSPAMVGITAIVASGGTGYTLGDTLTIVGATGISSQLNVATLSGNAVATVTFANSGNMTALPTNPVSVTGGSGSNATFTMTYGLATTQPAPTIAGSGYVAQPTVTFSGGGGTGAAAYATVGSIPTVRSLGSSLSFNTSAGEGFRVDNIGFSTLTDFIYVRGGASVSGAYIGVNGSSTNTSIYQSSKGTGAIQFFTNNWLQEQFRVAHTPSAVNYVQVTGAANNAAPALSAQGSDSTIEMLYVAKGGRDNRFWSSSSAEQFRVIHTAGTIVNQTTVTGSATGIAPIFGVRGTDTDIDLALRPKGNGVVRLTSGLLFTGANTITGANNGITFVDGTRQITAAASNAYSQAAFNLANTLQGGLNTANANISLLQGGLNTANANIAYILGVDLAQNTSISVAYEQANSKTFTFTQNTAPATANSADRWLQIDTGVVYQNFGNTTSPVWAEFGPGGTVSNTSNATVPSAYSNQYVLTGTTTGNAETEIFVSPTFTRIPVAANTVVYYTADITCRRTDVSGDYGSFFLKGVAANSSTGVVSNVGLIYELIVARTDANFLVDLQADNTNKSVRVYVTGAIGKTLSWKCVINTVEV